MSKPQSALSPAAGRTVPLEDGRAWPMVDDKPQPVTVPNTLYYRRRIADGDLVSVVPAAEPVGDLADAAHKSKGAK